MSNSEQAKRKRSKIAGFSKADSKYESIQAYFSDLNPIVNIYSEGYSYEDFLVFLEIIQHIENTEYLDIKYFDDIEGFDFLKRIQDYIDNYIGSVKSFNPKKKELEVSDPLMNILSSKVVMVYLDNFFDIKDKISKNVWNHIAYRLYVFHRNFEDSEFGEVCNDYEYDMLVDDFNSLDRIKPELLTSEEKLRLEELKLDIKYFDDFKEKIEIISKVETKGYKPRCKNKIEKLLLEYAQTIAEHNYETAMPFLEPDMDLEYWTERFDFQDDNELSDEQKIECAKSMSCERFYKGAYLLVPHNDERFGEMYIQMINDASNNCYWDFNPENVVVFTDRKTISKHTKERIQMKRFYYSCILFNELVEKIKDGTI